METQMPVQKGDVLAGKYRVERVLGQGGMGVVVAARHLELGELYAIKFLLPEALTSTQAVDRFLREARASARLKGEHVAKVHDVGRLETGSPYMVLEFLAGSDLQQLVRQRGPLPVDEAATYVIQACDAIAEAHSLGIIHRDIKPANLFLIQRPNGEPCIKVIDFGISKQTTGELLDLTKTGTVMGSPLYMAPEQMARTKDADARSDVWSMGVVLYKLLTGAVPFMADTLMEVVARALQDPHVPPSNLRPGLPVEVDAIVARCLQKRPENRFQSIQELAAALCPLVGMAGPWPHNPAALQVGRPSYPMAAPVHTSQPETAPVRASQPESGAAKQSGAASLERSYTGTTWGRTAGGATASKGAGKAVVTAVLALGVIALGGAGVWLLRPSSPDSAAPPEGLVVAPAAADTLVPVGNGAPALPGTAALPVATEAPSTAVVAPTTDIPESTSNALASDSPDVPSSPGKPTGRAVSGSGTAAPASLSTSKAIAPAPPSQPTPTVKPKKPKFEGVY